MFRPRAAFQLWHALYINGLFDFTIGEMHASSLIGLFSPNFLVDC
jgi:hypothetical protein